jgi:hypothetical protein
MAGSVKDNRKAVPSGIYGKIIVGGFVVPLEPVLGCKPFESSG